MERALFQLVKHTSKLCNGVGKGARHEHIVHVYTIWERMVSNFMYWVFEFDYNIECVLTI